MLTRNLNFGEGLVNGQKGVLLGVSPNSRVIQVQLLVLVPRLISMLKLAHKVSILVVFSSLSA